MKLLLTITEQDILPDKPPVDAAIFSERQAVRAVLLDDSGQVYFLHVTKHGYHKLPGGGINDGEDRIQALKRELLEEVGCRAEIIAELGTVVEYRSYEAKGLKQTSYCYLARQTGVQVASALEQDELEQGMVAVKTTTIDDAISLLLNDAPDNLEGRFIQKRDVTFLKEAKEYYG
jgi:8-oxo-dGTP diphosphatase